ncbi:hypothetical protein ADUPG1_004558 [Aduncisulcus paluster]|uniref:Uncharacterized protein n=2 Tax=Aduncisulcus paluster TaxID=2918883 RepID=A0ABQ5JZQ9_9EUKA|nr:hypothetical protein ADUPG1_004558 [Aduncisulcus paluster]
MEHDISFHPTPTPIPTPTPTPIPTPTPMPDHDHPIHLILSFVICGTSVSQDSQFDRIMAALFVRGLLYMMT